MLFGIDITDKGGWLVVAPRGDLDLASAPRVASALAEVPSRPIRVVVDLSRADLVDATGVGLLVGLRARVVDAGGRLVFCCPPSRRAELARYGLGDGFEVAGKRGSGSRGCSPLGCEQIRQRQTE